MCFWVVELQTAYSVTTTQYWRNKGKIRKEILSGADDFRAEIIKAMNNNSMDKEVATNLLENITELRGMVVNFKSGKVEEMLDIYKKLLPESDYKTVEKYSQ